MLAVGCREERHSRRCAGSMVTVLRAVSAEHSTVLCSTR